MLPYSAVKFHVMQQICSTTLNKLLLNKYFDRDTQWNWGYDF